MSSLEERKKVVEAYSLEDIHAMGLRENQNKAAYILSLCSEEELAKAGIHTGQDFQNAANPLSEYLYCLTLKENLEETADKNDEISSKMLVYLKEKTSELYEVNKPLLGKLLNGSVDSVRNSVIKAYVGKLLEQRLPSFLGAEKAFGNFFSTSIAILKFNEMIEKGKAAGDSNEKIFLDNGKAIFETSIKIFGGFIVDSGVSNFMTSKISGKLLASICASATTGILLTVAYEAGWIVGTTVYNSDAFQYLVQDKIYEKAYEKGLLEAAHSLFRNSFWEITSSTSSKDGNDSETDIVKLIANCSNQANTLGVFGKNDQTGMIRFLEKVDKLFQLNFEFKGNDDLITTIARFTLKIKELKRDNEFSATGYFFDFLNDYAPDVLLSKAIAPPPSSGEGRAIAFRYALLNMNPFVINIDDNNKTYYTTQHNSRGELDLYDPTTGKGTIVDALLKDSIAMNFLIRDAFGDYKTYFKDVQSIVYIDVKSDLVIISDRVVGINTGSYTKQDHILPLASGEYQAVIIAPDDQTGFQGSAASERIYVRNLDGQKITGGRGHDTIYGNIGNDTLYGEQGADTLIGGTGDDALYGDRFADEGIFDFEDKADDILYGELGNDKLYGDGGDDILYGDGREELYKATHNIDKIQLPVENTETGEKYTDKDLLDGGDGGDRLYGGLDDDILLGGSGNDIILGDFEGIHAKLAEGTTDNDILFGEDGSDWLYGGRGNDILFADGRTVLNKLINGLSNQYKDIITEGIENVFSKELIAAFADIAKNKYLVREYSHLDILNDRKGNGTDIDYLFGGEGNDILYASENINYLRGGEGNDIMYAGWHYYKNDDIFTKIFEYGKDYFAIGRGEKDSIYNRSGNGFVNWENGGTLTGGTATKQAYTYKDVFGNEIKTTLYEGKSGTQYAVVEDTRLFAFDSKQFNAFQNYLAAKETLSKKANLTDADRARLKLDGHYDQDNFYTITVKEVVGDIVILSLAGKDVPLIYPMILPINKSDWKFDISFDKLKAGQSYLYFKEETSLLIDGNSQIYDYVQQSNSGFIYLNGYNKETGKYRDDFCQQLGEKPEEGKDYIPQLGIVLETEKNEGNGGNGGNGGSDTPDYGDAKEQRLSPIVLDLDRNGINTTGLSTYFDHDGNGFSEKTAWVGKGDGLLVQDLNGDGIINNGTELFGNNTVLANGQKAVNGFEALAELDKNQDGVIDSKDAAYHTLKVWIDKNGNGRTDTGELLSLSEAGVASIGTGYKNTNFVDQNGNAHKQVGQITLSDGSLSTSTDIWFTVKPADRVENNTTELSAEIILLPDATGFGLVADLRQAMAKDNTLKELLSAVIAETDTAKLSSLLDTLIYRWTGSESVVANSRGSVMDARKLVALEKLIGQDFVGTVCNTSTGKYVESKDPHENSAPLLMAEYNKFKQFTLAQIQAQTLYNLSGTVILSGFGSLVDHPVVSWSRLEQKLLSLQTANQTQELKNILSIIEGIGVYSQSYTKQRQQFLLGLVQQQPEMKAYLSDIYLINELNQPSTIINIKNNTQYQAIKTIAFGQNIKAEDLLLTRSGDNLLISSKNGKELLSIEKYFYHDWLMGALDANGYRIETMLFANGVYWQSKDIQNAYIRNSQTDGDDIIYGFKETDDIIIGGKGNDTLYGQAGKDTYIFRKGDGQDVVYTGDINKDIIRFEGVNIEELDILVTDYEGILIKYGQNDQVQILNSQTSQKLVDRIITDNGEIIYGWNRDKIIGSNGNDIVYIDNWGGSVEAGKGNDTIYYQAISTPFDFYFNLGDGQDDVYFSKYYSTGIKRLIFGAGITTDMIWYQENLHNIMIGNGGDRITIKEGYSFHHYVFADGTVWTKKDILNNQYYSDEAETINSDPGRIFGGGGNDTITTNTNGDSYVDGGDGDDIIIGGGTLIGGNGNDTITGRGTLIGGNGNDVLTGLSGYNTHFDGGDGDDIITGRGTLIGGAGDDTLSGCGSFTGGIGNDIISAKMTYESDTFYFNLGDGQDIIYSEDAGVKRDYYYYQYAKDKIVFGAGITQDMIGYRIEGGDLVLVIGNQGDQITLKKYRIYENRISYRTIGLEFADGSVLEGNLDDLFDTYIGTDQADSLYLINSYNVKNIFSGAGDDIIYGNGVISGGTGNDTIYLLGNRNLDTPVILFNLGDGQDTIHATQNYKISFGAGISAQMLRFEMVSISGNNGISNDLIIKIGDQSEQITLNGYLSAPECTVGIQFADGSEWADLSTKLPVFTTYGSDAEDSLTGSRVDDIIYGGAGNDIIIDRQGNNYLDGGTGDDTLEGTGTFYGGKGNDTITTLKGKNDQNTILFNLGDGQDTIYGNEGSGQDRIVFGEGITQDMVSFKADFTTGNVLIKVGEQGDQITLSGYTALTKDYESIRYFEFADGTTLDWQKLCFDLFGQVLTNGDDDINGTRGRDYITALDGDDSIWDQYGGARNYIDGGAGNDSIYSWGTIIGGKGDDYLGITTGTYGNIVMFNLGDGKDSLSHEDTQSRAARNTIKFGPDVTADMISFRYGGFDDLVIRIGNQGDQITLNGYFTFSAFFGFCTRQSFSRFEFADGTVWEDFRQQQQFRDYIDSDKSAVTFNLGDGQKEFSNTSSQVEQLDRLIFGAGITTQMIRYQKINEFDLVILVGDQGDQLTFEGYFFDFYGPKEIKQLEFADGTVWGTDFLQKAHLLSVQNGSKYDETFKGGSSDDTIYGEAGNDTITDNFGNNYLDGGAGDDKITGRGTFVGGTGNDTIYAQQTGSADTFIFKLGDGQDTLYTTDSSKAADKIVFGAGISTSMIRYQKSGNDLTIIIGQNGDQMTFKNYYSNSNNQTIQQIEFADGTIWGSDFLQKTKTEQRGTSVANFLTGGSGDDVIYGEAGNDTITDNFGNNYLDGGAGDDKITGTGTFNGGIGNDTLNAKQTGSADTFIFKLGDGQDTLYTTDSSKAADKIVFGAGISTSMIRYQKSGNDLTIIIGQNGDQMTFKNYYSNSNNQTIQQIEFADGTIWGSDFLQKTKTEQRGTSVANTLTGGSNDDVIYGEAGNDTITDNFGNNYLDGGDGDDKITGTGTFNGGIGNDTLNAKQNGSADTFMFNRGDGKDTIYSQDTQLVEDKIVFAKDVTTGMLSYTKSGYNLILNVNGTTDQITIMNYFKGGQYQTINRLEFADGTVWQANGKTDTTFGYNVTRSPVVASAAVMGQVNNLISAMAAFAPEAGSSSMLPTNQYDPSTVLLGASAA